MSLIHSLYETNLLTYSITRKGNLHRQLTKLLVKCTTFWHTILIQDERVIQLDPVCSVILSGGLQNMMNL